MRKLPFEGVIVGTEPETISNPFSGASCELPPDAVAVYDAVKGAEVIGDYKIIQKGLAWFREHFSEEYMVLLD